MGYLIESVNECIMNGNFTELEACKLPTHQHLLLITCLRNRRLF